MKLFKPSVFTLTLLLAACSHQRVLRDPASTHFQIQVPETRRAQDFFPEVVSLKTPQIISKIENVEQLCIGGGVDYQKKWSRLVRLRQLQLGAELEARLLGKGFPSLDLKAVEKASSTQKLQGSDDQWKERGNWVRSLQESGGSLERCQLIELAFATSLVRLQTLEPSKPVCSFRDIMCDDPEELEYNNDRKRALWEFRYFRSLPKDFVASRPFEKSGARCDESEILKKAKDRADFVVDPSMPRRPLGYAVGMCGRSMTAHIIDKPFLSAKEGEKLPPEPKGWGNPLSPQEGHEYSDQEIAQQIVEIEGPTH